MSFKRFRYASASLWIAATAGVIGIVLHRANCAGVMLVRTGPTYFPTFYEITISLGILTAAIIAFLFCIERFKMWEIPWEDAAEGPDAPPVFDRASEVWLGTPRIAGRTVYSLVFVIALAVGFAAISTDRIESAGVIEVSAQPARGGDTLFVDGNLDGYGVSFAHEEHVKRLGNDSSCILCHHMNLPLDKNSRCNRCHNSMYTGADVFRHDWHASPDGGNLACGLCHEVDKERSAATAKGCDDCHKDMVPAGALITIEQYLAPSYVDAVHGTCVGCHKKKALELVEKETLGQCASCHNGAVPEYLPEDVYRAFRDTSYNHLVLPPISDAGQPVEESVE